MLTLCLAAAFLAVQPPRPDVDRERIMATIRELPASRAALGGPESIAGLDRAEAMLVEKLKALGYEPRTEPVRWTIPARAWPAPGAKDAKPGDPAEVPAHRTPPRAFYNIIADLPGRDLPSEILLIGAHYDAVPGAPGADDNGSGVAALLELARVLKDRPLRRTVRLVFFTLEEVGLEGSRVHARSYLPPPPREGEAPEATSPPSRLIGMVSLESIGFFTDTPDSQRSPIKAIEGVFEPRTVGDFLAAVTVSAHSGFCRRIATEMEKAAPGLKILPFDILPVPVPDMLRSDHAPFLAAGVPALMLTDTANFRNPNYHRATDTPDTIDADRLTLAVRGLSAAIEAIAEPAALDAKKTTPGAVNTGR